MKAFVYAKLFRLACWLLEKTVQLKLAAIGMPSDHSKISMLIFTLPSLQAKALQAAGYIADGANIEVNSTNETIH
jgi:hypothetical protein